MACVENDIFYIFYSFEILQIIQNYKIKKQFQKDPLSPPPPPKKNLWAKKVGSAEYRSKSGLYGKERPVCNFSFS